MKKFILILTAAALLTNISVSAQKNSFRGGIGVNYIHGREWRDPKIGPSVNLSYNRKFTDWLSADVTAMYDYCHVIYQETSNRIGMDGKVMFRPFFFVKWLDRLEVGGGPALDYRFFTFMRVGNLDYIAIQDSDSVYFRDYLMFGLDGQARIYFIDNNKFELFAFCSTNLWLRYHYFDTSYPWWYFAYDFENFGLMFGVKF